MNGTAIWKAMSLITTGLVMFSLLFWPMVLILAYENLDEWEGKHFPVVINTEILQSEPTPDNKATRLKIKFDKLRRCDPIEIVVTRLKDGTLVDNVFESDRNTGRMRSRSEGQNATKWWILQIPYIDALREDFRVEVVHKCHGLWNTRTLQLEGPMFKPVDMDDVRRGNLTYLRELLKKPLGVVKRNYNLPKE